MVNATPPPWTMVRDKIIGATGDDDALICHLELKNGQWQNNALLICAAPELLEALRRATAALEEAGKILPRDSKADMMASGALGNAYRLLRQIDSGESTTTEHGRT